MRADKGELNIFFSFTLASDPDTLREHSGARASAFVMCACILETCAAVPPRCARIPESCADIPELCARIPVMCACASMLSSCSLDALPWLADRPCELEGRVRGRRETFGPRFDGGVGGG